MTQPSSVSSIARITSNKPPRLGVLLSGGGARGAYQSGVLLGVAEIAAEKGISHPFKIVTGVSAGAVNAASLVASQADFVDVASKLTRDWSSITANEVFKTDALSAGRLGLKFALDAAGGVFSQKKLARSLLDTSPLRRYIEKNIPFSEISNTLRSGKIESLALTAMNYTNSHSMTFVQSHEPSPMWDRSRRRSIQSTIGVEHVMGSGAIPLFFPPVPIGDDHFGDGCLRNTAPLSPAIHLGADRILVISVRRPDHLAPPVLGHIEPSLARVTGVVLNALLMDAVEFDMERLMRINQTVDLIPQATRTKMHLRKLDYLWIRPSQDIGKIAVDLFNKLPAVIRYLVGGLGSKKEASELTSYLLFEPEFCGELVRLGREDAYANREAIEKFLSVS